MVRQATKYCQRTRGSPLYYHSFEMPLQRTFSFANLNNESHPGAVSSLATHNSSSTLSAIPVQPLVSYVMAFPSTIKPLVMRPQHTLSFVDENQPGGLVIDNSPFAVSAVHAQPLGSYTMAHPSIFKPPVMPLQCSLSNSLAIDNSPSAYSGTYTTTRLSIFKPLVTKMSTPRQSSPLGPCQYMLPGQPAFPPSARKLDLYHQALKRSARQTRRHIPCTGQKAGGIKKVV